jgi:hypothetical protein
MECKDIVQQTVCVAANIITTPEAKIGDIEACCVGEPVTEKCFREKNECVCTVRQLLCVRFPIKFSVHAEAKPAGIVCNKPEFSPCPPPDPCDPCNEPEPCSPSHKPGPCSPCDPCHKPDPCSPCHKPSLCDPCNKLHRFDSVVFKRRRLPLLFALAEMIQKGIFFSLR